MNMETVKFNLVSQSYKTKTLLVRRVPLTAGKIGKFRPLPQPIRLQDLVDLARSRTDKKINKHNVQVKF